jgi:hypothetical protein
MQRSPGTTRFDVVNVVFSTPPVVTHQRDVMKS